LAVKFLALAVLGRGIVMLVGRSRMDLP